jgi:6-phosphofructokinase
VGNFIKDKQMKKNEKSIHNLGVLTSGGDSQGMNAAVGAVIRTRSIPGWKFTPFTRVIRGWWRAEIISERWVGIM